MGIFFLIAIILIISLFTYFIININRIVRTVSSNYYWGREFNKTYENFEDYEESQSSNKMLNINSDLQTEQNTQSVQNTEGQSTENILDNIKKQSLQKGSSGTNPEEPSEFIKSSIKVMTNS
jgi:predicted PurR-regulated permease PerM